MPINKFPPDHLHCWLAWLNDAVADHADDQIELIPGVVMSLGEIFRTMTECCDDGDVYQVVRFAYVIGNHLKEHYAADAMQIWEVLRGLNGNIRKVSNAADHAETIREEVRQRMEKQPKDTVASAAAWVAQQHLDNRGRAAKGWSNGTIKRATKGMKKRKTRRRKPPD